MNQYQADLEAYRILSDLFSEAWGQPDRVPMPIALTLLHARDYAGNKIKDYFSMEDAGDRNSLCPVAVAA